MTIPRNITDAASVAGSTASTLAVTGAAIATAAVGGLVWWTTHKSDYISRQICPPEQLASRRRLEYKITWETVLQMSLKDSVGTVVEQVLEGKEVCDVFISKEFSKSSNSIISIVGIGKADAFDTEYYVWLQKESEFFRFKLKEFGLLLADAMEKQLTSTTMAFVCDSSSGLGNEIVAAILEEQHETLRVPVIQEPVWMAQLAMLVESKVVLQQETLVKILFGLVRLEAFKVRSKVGKARTVAFTLGQALVAPLASLLQAGFPCERHVFFYDGCVSSVARAVTKRKLLVPEAKTTGWKGKYKSIQMTTPLSAGVSKTLRTLPKALSELPVHLADATETWMTSVDAFLRLKADEKNNEYLPFVCKLANLVMLGTRQDRRLALINLLQFLTGSRSRSMPDDVVLEAQKSMMRVGMRQPQLSPFHPETYKQIEGCVFCHKGILIGDKTLIDTVKPSEEWTLKAAKKISGCACCAPGEEEEETDEMANEVNEEGTKENDSNGLMKPKEKPTPKVNGIDMSQPGAFALAFDANRK